MNEVLEWRATVDLAGPVFAGVMVVVSTAMGRKLSRDIPTRAVPESILKAQR